MATVTDIGQLIDRDPKIRGGRPCIAGTGITVHRIVQWHKMGESPKAIADEFPHLNLAQVYAALAYYFANYDEVEREIRAEEEEERQLYEEHRRRKDPSA
jgi:uncharacterized protein (DUF433 family)